MSDQSVTSWTIARGILIAVAVLVIGVVLLGVVWGVLQSRSANAEREERDCRAENSRWVDRGVPGRVRDCANL